MNPAQSSILLLLFFLSLFSLFPQSRCDFCQDVQDLMSQVRLQPPNNTLILGITDPNEELNLTAPISIYSDIFLFQNSRLNIFSNTSKNSSVTLYGNVYVTDQATLQLTAIDLFFDENLPTFSSNFLQSSELIVENVTIQSNATGVSHLMCFNSQVEFRNVSFAGVYPHFQLFGSSSFLGWEMSGAGGGLIYSQNKSVVNITSSSLGFDVILQYNCAINGQISNFFPTSNATVFLQPSCGGADGPPTLLLDSVNLSSCGIELVQYSSQLYLVQSQVYLKFISPQLTQAGQNTISLLAPGYYTQTQFSVVNSNIYAQQSTITDWRLFLGSGFDFIIENSVLSHLSCIDSSNCTVFNSVITSPSSTIASVTTSDDASLVFSNCSVQASCTASKTSFLRFIKSVLSRDQNGIVPTLIGKDNAIIILEDAIMFSEFNADTSGNSMIVGAGLGAPASDFNLTSCYPLNITGSIYSSRNENIVYLLELRDENSGQKKILASGTKSGVNVTLNSWTPVKGNFSVVLSVYTNNGIEASFAIISHNFFSQFEVLECIEGSNFDYDMCACTSLPLIPGTKFVDQTSFRIVLICLVIATFLAALLLCLYVYKSKNKDHQQELLYQQLQEE